LIEVKYSCIIVFRENDLRPWLNQAEQRTPPPKGQLIIPGDVVCLLSALTIHDITSQIPHEVHIALNRGTEPPRLEYPPIRVFWFTGEAFKAGIETHEFDRIELRVYGAAKTVVDCFKYRNKFGLDVAIEALI